MLGSLHRLRLTSLPARSSRLAQVCWAGSSRASARRCSNSRRVRSLKDSFSASSATLAALARRSSSVGEGARLPRPMPFFPVNYERQLSDILKKRCQGGQSALMKIVQGTAYVPDHSLRGSGFTNRLSDWVVDLSSCGGLISRSGLRVGSSCGDEDEGWFVLSSSAWAARPRAWPGLKPIFIIMERALFSDPRPDVLSSSARSKRLLDRPSSRDSISSCLRLLILF
jgi:hypothetical protein